MAATTIKGEAIEIPVVSHDGVLSAISPEVAVERVFNAFVQHARGVWTMPPKVYVAHPPFGDFRAMPALGDGVALLKWVTSFPGNPSKGLPVVSGIVLLSDASDGRPLAIIDGRAVTALRTGAAAVVASQTLANPEASSVGIVGCGQHGTWAGRCLAAAGFGPGVCSDMDRGAADRLAGDLGWQSGTVADALQCDIVVTVTPGDEPVVGAGRLRKGQHINALGADGPGKSEVDIEALQRCVLFCDEWEQASHGGELSGAVGAGIIRREHVTDLGNVLTGAAEGRTSPDAITLFDSTGLAIQDLAIALAILEGLDAGRVETVTIEF